MYNSRSYSYDYPRAVVRQDEALDDLIKSTRQVIRRHSEFMTEQQPHRKGSNYTTKKSCSHHRGPALSSHYSQPYYPPQQHYPTYQHKSYPHPHDTYMEPPRRQYKESVSPPHHHYKQSPSYQHYKAPISPPPRPYYKVPISPSSPAIEREYRDKSPVDSVSKTKKWLNRFIPTSYHSPPSTRKEDSSTHDDQIGLFELKETIRRSTSKPKLPPSRPMIIPASMKTSPEKIVIVDVPLDTTVILRSVQSSKETSLYHVTDLEMVEEILGHHSPEKVHKVAKPLKNKIAPLVTKIKSSETAPNLSNLRTTTVRANDVWKCALVHVLFFFSLPNQKVATRLD